MPHGLTYDRHGNIWVTDVALHQVMKFHPEVGEPKITIGVRFSPGSSVNHLCKPTAVAVASSGEVCWKSVHFKLIKKKHSQIGVCIGRLLQQSDFEI